MLLSDLSGSHLQRWLWKRRSPTTSVVLRSLITRLIRFHHVDIGHDIYCAHRQSDAELMRLEEEERAQMEVKERERFRERLRLQRLESEADSKWLQEEEQNIELPFSPPPVRISRHVIDFGFTLNRVSQGICL